MVAPPPEHTRHRRVIGLHWLVVVAAAVFATQIMWAASLLWGHSAWSDLVRMVEFNAAIRAGDYFPAWSPDLYHGYGSPLFQFYAPLSYYVTEIPVLAGIDLATALKITQLLLLAGSGLTMYHLAIRHVSRWAACFAAVLYMIAPYRLLDLFVRHAMAEHAAFLWLPLLILGTERFAVDRRTGLLLGTVAAAGLILTHNVMALIGLPVCVAAGWILSEPKDQFSALRAVVPAATGVGCTAFFWWPALAGRELTRAQESLTGGYFDYHQHFAHAARLVDLTWNFGESITNNGGLMPLQIGLPHLAVGLAALILILAKRRATWTLLGVGIMGGAIFMVHSFSQPIWDCLPLLSYVQFPWRFLGLAVLGAAMCGAGLLDWIRKSHPRMEWPSSLAGIILVMVAYFPYYSTAQFLAVDAQTKTMVRATAERVVAMEKTGVLLPFDRIVTPTTIRIVGERATSSDDFLPRSVLEKPTAPAPQPLLVSNGELRQCDRTALNRYRATVAMTTSGRVELQQFWFPGWTASIDGRPTEVASNGTAALVSCNVPAGDHVVEFAYTRPPQRRVGAAVSLMSAIVLAAAMFVRGKSL